MNIARICLVLIGAALLEVGGDALIRRGLQHRLLLLLAGSLSLVAYGFLVNQSRVDFGRLMGAYIAVFFVVSQVVAVGLLGEVLLWRTLVAGALIVAGGCVLLI